MLKTDREQSDTKEDINIVIMLQIVKCSTVTFILQ